MRAVIQRVSEASVKVDGEVIGQIGQGLLVLLAIHKDDTLDLVPKMIQKLIHLRIFSDATGKMNLSLQDVNGEILVISQFTLYANTQGGRRPDFLESAPPAKAEDFYNQFLVQLKSVYPRMQSGRFGADMKVSLLNDGPVTIQLEV